MNDPSPNNEPLLVYDHLTVSYSNGKRVPVLEAFSLALHAGTFLAVVGPSGCGKSTLLHVTAGFIKSDSGSIRLNGQVIVKPSMQVGFVSQRYALFPWLTVADNIAFGPRSQRQPEGTIRQTLDHLLDVIGLARYRTFYPEQLSGGMQQRVALARAMATRPPVLLLDEPFSALDSETRHRMRELLLRLWAEQRTTILFVTHDLDEALLLADRVLVLECNAGPARTIDVPFPRPRSPSISQTEVFRAMVGAVSRTYGSVTTADADLFTRETPAL